MTGLVRVQPGLGDDLLRRPDAGARGGAEVDAEDDVGVEDASSASKSPARAAARNASTTSRCAAEVGVGAGAAPWTLRRARLASCRAAAGRAVDDRCDLVERQPEQVVQHEGQPLGRRERLEHDEQREADRVGEQRFVLGVERRPG